MLQTLAANPIISFLYDSLRENLGTPVKLLRLLEQRPDIRVQIEKATPVIGSESIVQWHRWGEHIAFHWRRPLGRIMGMKHSGGYYSSFEINLPELANFGQSVVTEQWTCDIQNVDGLSASKSTLTDFTSLDDMVEANSREMIDEITEEKLQKNLAHTEIRILHEKETTSDHFARYLWDGRLFLMNNGGSHHFAAARYIASRLSKRPVPLTGKLYTHSINPEAVDGMRRDFNLYLMSSDAGIFNSFHDAMKSFRATYFLLDMPRPYGRTTTAVLLPKSDPRSVRVSNELRNAGLFDLGHYFEGLCGAPEGIA